MQIMFFIEITLQKMRKVASEVEGGGGGTIFDNAQKENLYEAVPQFESYSNQFHLDIKRQVKVEQRGEPVNRIDSPCLDLSLEQNSGAGVCQAGQDGGDDGDYDCNNHEYIVDKDDDYEYHDYDGEI